ncbi:MAG: hypothetical protein BGO49_05640 [Planctomycetales bacterium 71-10]|nr:MAG: hypothetical protein BGO49_05640 [Planctomycetales bacterium 71-10]
MKRKTLKAIAWVVAITTLGFIGYAEVSGRWLWMSPLCRATVEPGGSGDALFVLIHGFQGSPEDFGDVRRAIRDERPDADVMAVQFSAHTFSNADPARIAAELSDLIEAQVGSPGKGYKSVTLIGYSMGAPLARKTLIYGCNEADDDPAWNPDAPPKEWTRLVDRVVLLAGMNRGMRLDQPAADMPLAKQIHRRFGKTFARLTDTARLVRSFEAGEPFIADLRVQWMRTARRRAEKHEPWPAVIQLLGTIDDVVSTDDNRDVSVTQDFIFVPVRGTGHLSVLDFRDPAYGAERERKFRSAIAAGDLADLLKRYPPVPVGLDPNVERIVFVMHGIRDMADWTADVEVFLKEAYTKEKGFGGPEALKVIKSSYGYFPMGPFLLYGDRQRNVRWFMDQYTEALARYPNAKQVDFIGHSNGTYILASALERYKTLRVGRVVFAGSVVPRAYDWSSKLGRGKDRSGRDVPGRVLSIRNYVGSADWVVGFFPRFFEWCGSRDVGSAGFNGFLDDGAKDHEVKFVTGGHSCALDPRNYPSIVDFLLFQSDTPEKEAAGTPYRTKERTAWIYNLSQFCWAVWLGLTATILALGWLIVSLAGVRLGGRIGELLGGPARPRAGKAAALAAYVAVLLAILYSY